MPQKIPESGAGSEVLQSKTEQCLDLIPGRLHVRRSQWGAGKLALGETLWSIPQFLWCEDSQAGSHQLPSSQNPSCLTIRPQEQVSAHLSPRPRSEARGSCLAGSWWEEPGAKEMGNKEEGVRRPC